MHMGLRLAELGFELSRGVARVDLGGGKLSNFVVKIRFFFSEPSERAKIFNISTIKSSNYRYFIERSSERKFSKILL